MRNHFNKRQFLLVNLFSFIFLLATGGLVWSQSNDANSGMVTEVRPEMADAMRSNGKIYVVVAVVLLILIGTIVYLVRIDRKLSRLEKKQ